MHVQDVAAAAAQTEWRRQLARFMGMAAAGTALLGLAPPHVSQQAFHPAVLPLGFAVLLCFEPWKRPAST